MKRVFADTGYWVALLNPRDDLNARAKEVSRGLGAVRIYTTEMVLVEVANMFGKEGATFRALVQATIASLRENPNVTIEPQTSTLFREALVFYAAHPDKDWSLTDCASFLVLRQEEITAEIIELAAGQTASRRGGRERGA